MILVPLAFAADPMSPESARWADDARVRIARSWNACVDAIPPGVPLPEPSYTTVAELDVNADGTPDDARIVRASGSDALDACVTQAVKRSAPFPVPPPAMLGSDGVAHVSEVVLTVQLASTPAPKPASGPLVEAKRDPAATAAAVAAKATRVGILDDGGRNIWCGGSGEKLSCDIRDKRGSMLVFTVKVCRSGGDLRFDSVVGPMVVKGAAELVPSAEECR